MSRQKKKEHQSVRKLSPKDTAPSWYAGKMPIVWFALKFGLLMVLFYGLMATPFVEGIFYAYLEVTARVANAVLNAFGIPTRVSEVTIQSPQFSIAIRRGCDAVEPTWLFCASVISFRESPLHKLAGILAGIVVLQLLNLARIVTLYWIGLRAPAFFNTAHTEIWPTAFILVTILLFVGWIEWAGKQTPPHAAA